MTTLAARNRQTSHPLKRSIWKCISAKTAVVHINRKRSVLSRHSEPRHRRCASSPVERRYHYLDWVILDNDSERCDTSKIPVHPVQSIKQSISQYALIFIVSIAH